MDKNFWGPEYWHTIHLLAISLTTKEQIPKYIEFVRSLQLLLPCVECRKHFQANLKTLPPEKNAESNETLFLWSYMFHDLVNKQLHKKSISFDYARRKYIDMMSYINNWGPHVWRVIHTSTINYNGTAQNFNAYKTMIKALTHILPCTVCSEHLKSNLRDINMDNFKKDNHQLFTWSYILHDYVNVQLKKKRPGFQSVYKFYFDNACEGCKV